MLYHMPGMVFPCMCSWLRSVSRFYVQRISSVFFPGCHLRDWILNIHIGNGQKISGSRTPTHSLCGNQSRKPHNSLSAVDPKQSGHGQWLPTSYLLPLLPTQDQQEKAHYAPQTNPIACLFLASPPSASSCQFAPVTTYKKPSLFWTLQLSNTPSLPLNLCQAQMTVANFLAIASIE